MTILFCAEVNMYHEPGKPTCIAIADDDPKLVRLTRRNLELAGYRVVCAGDGPSAIELVESADPDLLVLDVVMPGLDGCQVLQRLREFTNLPVIIVSGKDDEQDIVRGLEAGADDYLTKPYASRELLARVQAVLRRASLAGDPRQPATIDNGELHVDLAQHLVLLRGQEIPLTPTEYRLLACLAQHRGRTLTQDDLLVRVWGNGYQDEAHLLRVNISRLRAKLGEAGQTSRFVVTKPGVGYTMPRWEADARPALAVPELVAVS